MNITEHIIHPQTSRDNWINQKKMNSYNLFTLDIDDVLTDGSEYGWL
jgi:hypothetical protein